MALLSTSPYLGVSRPVACNPRFRTRAEFRGTGLRSGIGILLVFLVTGLLSLYFKAFRNTSLEGVVNAQKYVV